MPVARRGEDRRRRRACRGVGASAKSLRIAKWMRGSRLPSASTSRCSSSAATPVDARQQRRHDRPSCARRRARRPEKSRRGRRRGGDRRRPRRAGRARSRRRSPAAAGAAPATTSGQAARRRWRVGDADGRAAAPVSERDRAEVERRRVREDEAPQRGCASRGRYATSASRSRRPVADQVVADVRGAVARPTRSPRPGARSRRLAAPRAPAPRRSARPAPRRPGAAGRGSGSPCAP